MVRTPEEAAEEMAERLYESYGTKLSDKEIKWLASCLGEVIEENTEALIEEVSKVPNLRRELTQQRDNNHQRNLDLDALHYVWCNGGCEYGVHRYGHRTPLTEEIMEAARKNMSRLESWWANKKFKSKSSQ